MTKVEKWEKHQDTVYWVDIQLALRKRIQILSNKIERNHLVRHSQLIVSQDLLWWNLEGSCARKYLRHLDLLQRFLLKDEWTKELDSETKNAIIKNNEIVSNHKVCLPRRSKKDVLFGCECTSSRSRRPLNASSFSKSCVPVSVERVDKDRRRGKT